MLYIGLDVHWKTTTCCVLNDAGRVMQTRTLRGPWERAVTDLRSLGQDLAVCFEASVGYGPLHEALSAFCRRVQVAHPGHLRLIFRSKRKNDRVDAQKLAKLLYLDEVPAVHVPSVDVRAWRELIEFRRRSIDKRTKVKNQLRCLLRAYAMHKPREVGGLWTKAGLAWLSGVELPTATARIKRELLLEELTHLQAQVGRVTAELDRIGAEHPGVALLQTIPGVGPRTAEVFIAYVDDPKRFARNNRVPSYFGLVPSQDASAGVNRLGHITKRGPATARKLLVEASWQMIRRDPATREYFDRLVAGKPERRKSALVATAHRLVRIMHAMLSSGEVYRSG
jgi:transposase